MKKNNIKEKDKNRNYKKVIDSIDQYLESDNSAGIDAKALFIMAKSYCVLKMKDEGIKIYKMIINLNPKDVHARLELGKLYVGQGKEQEAEELFKEYMELAPKNIYARLELGKLYARQGKEQETETLYPNAPGRHTNRVYLT